MLLTQLVLAFGGIQGGIRLLIDPTGFEMGIHPELRNSFPVDDFFLAGVFVLITFGLTPLFLAGCLWGRVRIPIAEAAFNGYNWAWGASVGLSILLLAWTLVLVSLIGYRTYYQLIDGLMALLLLNLQLHPKVRKLMIYSKS
ncbi:hypothetical protein [Larkinella terrae]|uniref:Uncharacterized protein n=1 Tax=Larkinella terrae TaxID=2025311 RepID=A0A7K0EUX1_9BACT|nr:hypothetical protein [Larkinella terrae]MRS65311.1 hypothetical protein [Larkinella terrae]